LTSRFAPIDNPRIHAQAVLQKGVHAMERFTPWRWFAELRTLALVGFFFAADLYAAPPATRSAAPAAANAEGLPDLDAAHSAYLESLRLLCGTNREKDVKQGMEMLEIAARGGDPRAVAVLASMPRMPGIAGRVMLVPKVSSARAAEKLEKELETDPLDIGARMELILYYRLQRAGSPAEHTFAEQEKISAKIREHLIWMIENCPDAPFMPVPWDDTIIRIEDGGRFEGPRGTDTPIKDAWMRQVKEHPKNAGILCNAGLYVYRDDAAAGREMAGQAFEMDRQHPTVRYRQLRANREVIEDRAMLSRRTTWPERRPLAKKLFEAAEQILQLTKGTKNEAELLERADLYRVAGMSALDLSEYDTARRYAEALLSKEDRFKPELEKFGLAAHYGHIILGRIALHDEKVADARAHLRQAQEALPKKWPRDVWSAREGSKLSIHPDVSLADELFRVDGARDDVLNYLHAIEDRQFRQPVTGWIWDIQHGLLPKFESELDY
jgi:tetratricopeptide (TPR) repeat protein